MIEAVLFDLGNTLMCDQAGNARLMLEAAGRPLHAWLLRSGFRPPAYEAYIRRIRRHFLRAFLWSVVSRREVRLISALQASHRSMGVRLDPDQVSDMGLQCLPMLGRFFSPFSETRSLLERLHVSGLKLGVVSNTMVPGFAMDEHLRGAELLQYLPVRIYSSEVGYKKPNRRIFRLALNRIGAEPERTLFIGDSARNDIHGPSRMGMKTAFLSPDGRPPRRRTRPNHVIRSLAEVPALLQLRA